MVVRSLMVIGLGCVAMGGCASSPSSTTSSAPSTPSIVPPATAHSLLVPDAFSRTKVFTIDGKPATWGDVIEKSTEAEVVIIAEQHGHPIGLSAAAAMWSNLLSHWPWNGFLPVGFAPLENPPALALEFFERDDQSRIDDYLAGLSTEEVFLKRTGKSLAPGADPWASGYPPGHRDMLVAAKAAKLPVIAANAPRAYVRLARTQGYTALANLTPEQQRLVVLPHFAADGNRPDNRYWRDFLSFMGSTPDKYASASAQEREKTDSMFRAQSIWDATMADAVRAALARGNAPVFLVIGQFHADFAADGGGGTVQALKAARPETKVVVVSFQDADPNGGFRAEDKGRADFVVYAGARPEQPSK